MSGHTIRKNPRTTQWPSKSLHDFGTDQAAAFSLSQDGGAQEPPVDGFAQHRQPRRRNSGGPQQNQNQHNGASKSTQRGAAAYPGADMPSAAGITIDADDIVERSAGADDFAHTSRRPDSLFNGGLYGEARLTKKHNQRAKLGPDNKRDIAAFVAENKKKRVDLGNRITRRSYFKRNKVKSTRFNTHGAGGKARKFSAIRNKVKELRMAHGTRPSSRFDLPKTIVARMAKRILPQHVASRAARA